MSQKSQVTLFIILFVVGLILTFFILSIRNFLVNQSFDEGSKDILSSLDSTSFSTYLDDCVGSEITKTLSVLLSQGGYLFEEDNGVLKKSDMPSLHSDKYYYISLSSNVPFIYNLDKNIKPIYPYSGLYTLNNYGIPDGIFNSKTNIPYFGTLNLPSLCMRGGPNDPNTSYSKFSCSPDLYNRGILDEDRTIQSQLSSIVASKVFECIERPSISERYSLTISDFTTFDVIFGDSDIIISSDLSITYFDDSSKKELFLDLTYPLDFKNFYSFIHDILDKESKLIDYDISSDYVESKYFEPNYLVTLAKDFIGTADLLTVENTIDMGLLNNSLSFFGIIENRRPYLEYIPSRKTSGHDQGITASSELTRTSSFIVRSFDPDGDTIATTSVNISNLSPISSEFSTISPALTSEGNVYSYVGKCSSQCNSLNSKYIDTTYNMNITISDGELEDYQEFDITILN